MHGGVHRDMAFQVLKDQPNKELFEFLIRAMSKPEWKEKRATQEEWLKEWMDMPDDKHHTSKMYNDHSYKLERVKNRFRIKFIGGRSDQATVIARLKYDCRDVKEWVVEEEWRTAALELAKSIHWVIDVSTPPHTVAAWDEDLHSRVENHFDKKWKKFYDKDKVVFGRKKEIKDIYRWAKKFVEEKYDRNYRLYEIYKSKGSISKGEGEQIGREVIHDVAQNLADYLAHFERKKNFTKMLGTL